MQREECIYNLISAVVPQVVKPSRYLSKHDPLLQPTGTTFGLQGKTRVAGANLGSNARLPPPKSAAGIGRETRKPDAKSFIKKGERCNTLMLTDSAPKQFAYTGKRMPKVVKRDERPVMGLKSGKNYLTTNAVDAILAVPGTRAASKFEPPQYRNKQDYGQVPKYLSQVKDEIEWENQLIEHVVRQNSDRMDDDSGNQGGQPLDEHERQQLVNALKAKWDNVNAKYQKLCHNVVFDTLGKVRRKETLEKELTQLEKDIDLLEKGPVVITHDTPHRHPERQ
ncbi:unnamed protein product [Albugo candida]|nr:unnamed protein product [Albugo candida]|eukprot:CCI43503.1 unnamed protein product [Albugo candida]